MPIPPQAAGTLLRTYRTQRGMTLRDAALRAQTSISSLSRKERGVDTLHREFLLHVVEGYALNAWEADALFTAAQIMPDADALPLRNGEERAFIRGLLASLPFPAAVLGPLEALYAWNLPLEYTWPSLRAAGDRERNALDLVFAPETRAALGDGFALAAERALCSFWAQTQLYAGSPAFLALIERLCAEYGESFAAPWQRALAAVLQGGALDGGAGAVLPAMLRLADGPDAPDSAGGAGADCVVLRATLQERRALPVLLVMPYGAASAHAYAAAGEAPEWPVIFAGDRAPAPPV